MEELLPWSLGSCAGEAVLQESVFGLQQIFAGTCHMGFSCRDAGGNVEAEERVFNRTTWPSKLILLRDA